MAIGKPLKFEDSRAQSGNYKHDRQKLHGQLFYGTPSINYHYLI